MNMNENLNRSIQCSVSSCKNNNSEQGFCALDRIVIGTHEPNPTNPECVDCKSFVKKNCCG